MREQKNRMRKTINRVLAIQAAVPAIGPNPSQAARIAAIKNINAQCNITNPFIIRVPRKSA
jgi:hypothetical protein